VFSQRQGKNLAFLAKSLIGTDREQAAGAQSCPFGYMLAAWRWPVRSSSSNAQTMEDPMPSEHDKIDRQKVIASLNTILELELAGVVRYLHYSLMVFGHARIPIIGWMRNQATEGMNHASMAGEHVTALGGHPSLKIGKLAESHKHDIIQILQESLDHERTTLREYYNLLELVVDKSVWLEDYARAQIVLEEQHISEVEKMMRKPGELHPAG